MCMKEVNYTNYNASEAVLKKQAMKDCGLAVTKPPPLISLAMLEKVGLSVAITLECQRFGEYFFKKFISGTAATATEEGAQTVEIEMMEQTEKLLAKEVETDVTDEVTGEVSDLVADSIEASIEEEVTDDIVEKVTAQVEESIEIELSEAITKAIFGDV